MPRVKVCKHTPVNRGVCLFHTAFGPDSNRRNVKKQIEP